MDKITKTTININGQKIVITERITTEYFFNINGMKIGAFGTLQEAMDSVLNLVDNEE